MININTVVEVIYYVLSKIGRTDTVKVVKLIWLTDKYHLIRYGRTVTNDVYYSMAKGPVGSTVKDILSLKPKGPISPSERSLESKLIRKFDDFTFDCKTKEYKIRMLSQSDTEALDFIIGNFGAWNSPGLVAESHRYPEWYKYKGLFQKGIKRKRIETKELLSVIPGDLLGMPKGHIQISEEILSKRLN